MRPARRSKKYFADGLGPVPLTVTACTSGATSDAISESRRASAAPGRIHRDACTRQRLLGRDARASRSRADIVGRGTTANDDGCRSGEPRQRTVLLGGLDGTLSRGACLVDRSSGGGSRLRGRFADAAAMGRTARASARMRSRSAAGGATDGAADGDAVPRRPAARAPPRAHVARREVRLERRAIRSSSNAPSAYGAACSSQACDVHVPASSTGVSVCRNFSIPARIRVFTVPSGSDRCAAISLCDSPPK